MNTARSVNFDPAEHLYTLAGRPLINVTRVLDYFNTELRQIPETILAIARGRGTAVHTASALDDRGVLDESSCDDNTLAYLEGYRQFRKDSGFAPTLIEARVYHPQMDYAGTLDRGGTLNGKWAQIDLKTGVPSRFEALQTAAYSDAWEHGGGKAFEARYVVRLHPDFPRGYKLEQHRGPLDRLNWRSMLNTYRFLISA